jgi:hypothetical protein
MSDDRLTPAEAQDMFISPEQEAKALFIRHQDEQVRSLRNETKQKMLSLVESARLKEAKQESFDFVKPGPDWGSTTWQRR